jgi:hypothetical protein
VFESAARETRWNYQWIVMNELLPTLVGRSLVDQREDGRLVVGRMVG